MTKKIVMALVIVGFTALFCSTALAGQENSWVEKAQGKNSPWSRQFFAQVPGGSCTVYEKTDGVVLIGTDYDWHGKVAIQSIGIRNGLIEMNHTQAVNGPIETRGYWVFSVKCREITRELPAEVRNKFNGNFVAEN